MQSRTDPGVAGPVLTYAGLPPWRRPLLYDGQRPWTAACASTTACRTGRRVRSRLTPWRYPVRDEPLLSRENPRLCRGTERVRHFRHSVVMARRFGKDQTALTKERQPDSSISRIRGFPAYCVLAASPGRLRLGPFEGPAIESPRLCRGIVTRRGGAQAGLGFRRGRRATPTVTIRPRPRWRPQSPNPWPNKSP